MTLLSVKNVSVRFGGVAALTAVSLDLPRDSLLGFIGPNGAGKTTLMRAITGILSPDQGQIIFNGTDVTGLPVHRRVALGMALAQQLVKPLVSFNLRDNVAFAVGHGRLQNPLKALKHAGRKTERARADELLQKVGIADAADSMPGALPLGYLKRLEVARALALEPQLLLLDEPLAGLNQSEARSMADLIAGLYGDGRSVLLIEHNIREVARICPHLYVQENGRGLLQGPTAEVMASPELRRAYLGTAA